MSWLLCFAFVTLTAVSTAFDPTPYIKPEGHDGKLLSPGGPYFLYNFIPNSFPYILSLEDGNDKEYHTSSIVSMSTGPLCSGFHVTLNVVLTAASCVYREKATELFVISYKNNSLSDYSQSEAYFLRVQKYKIHDFYNPQTGEHNIAALLVKKGKHSPEILKLPTDKIGLGAHSITYIPKYMYKFGDNEFDYSYYARTQPVRATTDLSGCRTDDDSFSPEPFLCVSRMNSEQYEYSSADLGTPLILFDGNYYFIGLFGHHDFYSNKSSYLYQNGIKNLDFVKKFISLYDK